MGLRNSGRFEAVLEAFHAIQQSALQDTADEWLRTNLTMAQIKALLALQHTDGTTVGSLADRLQIGLSAASIVVDKLVQLGMLHRHEDPQDRRRTLVELTPRARQLLLRLQQGRREVLENLLAQLSDEDYAALLQGVEALARVTTGPLPAGHRK